MGIFIPLRVAETPGAFLYHVPGFWPRGFFAARPITYHRAERLQPAAAPAVLYLTGAARFRDPKGATPGGRVSDGRSPF